MLYAAASHIAKLHALSVVAVLSLLTLPVDLRAGLRDPHPHALFQIIDDAADGAIDHDHDAVDQGYGVHEHHHTAASTDRADISPDLPRLSDDGSGAGDGLAAALFGASSSYREATATRVVNQARTPLRGIALRPLIPPPREVA